MLDFKDAIILAIASQGGPLASLATEKTGLSRVAISRRIQKLANDGYLLRHGTGTRQTFSLGTHRFWLDIQNREHIEQTGGEMMIWERHIAPLLIDLPQPIRSLANTAFTEMLNNALDHSEGNHVLMGVHLKNNQLEILVADDGIGVFKKIATALQLFDPRLAILELAKGKFTTAPQGHSGMGIFVSSRMMSGFSIESLGLRFDPHETQTPLSAFDWVHQHEFLDIGTHGTVVRMSLSLNSQVTPNQVYLKYFAPDEIGGDASHTTEIPIRLAQLSSELVSRSQAKWVMERATQFKTVILDFDGVTHVGQAFVDEIFRVFACAHPNIQLKTMNMTQEVAQLVQLFSVSTKNSA